MKGTYRLIIQLLQFENDTALLCAHYKCRKILRSPLKSIDSMTVLKSCIIMMVVNLCKQRNPFQVYIIYTNTKVLLVDEFYHFAKL